MQAIKSLQPILPLLTRLRPSFKRREFSKRSKVSREAKPSLFWKRRSDQQLIVFVRMPSFKGLQRVPARTTSKLTKRYLSLRNRRTIWQETHKESSLKSTEHWKGIGLVLLLEGSPLFQERMSMVGHLHLMNSPLCFGRRSRINRAQTARVL